jgi:hypothetical protein
MKPAAQENPHVRRTTSEALKAEDSDWRWYAFVLGALVLSGLALAALVMLAS